MKEADMLRQVMVDLSPLGSIMFRNQIGSYKTGDRYITYGVCNPGGSDLLGPTKVRITPEMVGRTMAIFTALEGKIGNAQPTEEQQRFIDFVIRSGGIGGVVRSSEEAVSLILRFQHHSGISL